MPWFSGNSVFGKFCTVRDGEGVLLEAEFARGMGLGLNDEIKLLTRRGVWKTRVAGLLRARGAGSFDLGNLVFLPLKTAQRVFAASGRVDVIQLVADDATSSDKLLAEVARRLPIGAHVDRSATRTRLVEQTMLASDLGLQMAVAFAVLLATFIILSTFLMNVAERRRQLAILRCETGVLSDTSPARRRRIHGAVLWCKSKVQNATE